MPVVHTQTPRNATDTDFLRNSVLACKSAAERHLRAKRNYPVDQSDADFRTQFPISGVVFCLKEPSPSTRTC